jgi:hypothetical protein
MRIFRSLVLFLLLLFFFSAIIFFVSREIFLALGINKITHALATLKQLEEREQFVADCATRGSSRIEGQDLVRYQLRFENNKDFVLEAVCSGFSLSPILIESNSLPYMVEKNPGESGIMWGDYLSGLSLSVLGRSGVVYVEDRKVVAKYSGSRETIEGSFQPTSACVNYGFYCCQNDFEKGVGEQLTIVTDCPKSCYSLCKPRPVVLSFTSQPYFDTDTRKLMISSGETVTFFYVISDSQEKAFQEDDIEEESSFFSSIYSMANDLIESKKHDAKNTMPSVTIDFGDGSQESLTELQGSTSHSYLCSNSIGCDYEVVISATNSRGVESASNILSSLNILVN